MIFPVPLVSFCCARTHVFIDPREVNTRHKLSHGRDTFCGNLRRTNRSHVLFGCIRDISRRLLSSSSHWSKAMRHPFLQDGAVYISLFPVADIPAATNFYDLTFLHWL